MLGPNHAWILPHALLTNREKVSLFRRPLSPGGMGNTSVHSCENSTKKVSMCLAYIRDSANENCIIFLPKDLWCAWLLFDLSRHATNRVTLFLWKINPSRHTSPSSFSLAHRTSLVCGTFQNQIKTPSLLSSPPYSHRPSPCAFLPVSLVLACHLLWCYPKRVSPMKQMSFISLFEKRFPYNIPI